MSYFHEYTNRRDHKTLREYSVPFDLRRVDPEIWVTGRKQRLVRRRRARPHQHFSSSSAAICAR